METSRVSLETSRQALEVSMKLQPPLEVSRKLQHCTLGVYMKLLP
jgi:hypothetical protein